MKTHRLGALVWLVGHHTFWLRLSGRGLWFKLLRHHEPLFSERYGFDRVFYLGPIVVKVLRKTKWQEQPEG